MIRTLAWKEYREHRAVWLTMAIMTCVMGVGLVELVSARDTDGSRMAVQALTVMGMAAAYGVVCGGMMFAGEREAGTLVFLDIFWGRRGLLWFWKALIGAVLAATEALAVGLALHLLEQVPAPWLATIVGRDMRPIPGSGTMPAAPDTTLWLVVLPAMTLEAYAWGLLGSSMVRRALSGAGVAVLMMAPLWLFAIFAPPQGSFIVRLIAAGIALFFSLVQFLGQSRDAPLGAPPRRDRPPPLKSLMEKYRGTGKFDLERRAPELAQRRGPGLVIPLATADAPAERVRARGPQIPQAGSPGQVLRWLTFRQARVQLGVLAGVGFLLGLLLPALGHVVWPTATLLLGVLCGTAAFAQEQSDLSYQYLAAQHLPLNRFWSAKVVFWLAAAVLLSLVMAAGGCVLLLGRYAAMPRPRPPFFVDFNFGELFDLMGAPLFLGGWLLYGFAMGQLFVLFCRKNVLAVLLASVAAAGALGLWLPSLLCRGMSGWPVWLPPLALLAVARLLMRAWAGGRIKERRPMAALAAFSAAALGWALLLFAFRAWEIPAVNEPMDREAFRQSVPTPQAKRGAQKTLEAIGELGGPQGNGPWLAPLKEAARLPAGTIEGPLSGGRELLLRHLEACRIMTAHLRGLGAEARQQEKPDAALDRIALILHISRTLRKKASLTSCLDAVSIEGEGVKELELCLAQKTPGVRFLQRALDELNRHATETPGPVECLQTEYFRAGVVVESPAAWSFHPRSVNGSERLSATWLANWVVFSLDVPWEKERHMRLWRAVWAGLFRTIEAPHGSLSDRSSELGDVKESTRNILRGWSPVADGPGSSLTAARLARLLDASWLSDERLFIPVHGLRVATLAGRWRVDACRLRLALSLYQIGENKPAAALNDLAPKYMHDLPADPYTGRPFHYRISQGETIALPEGAIFQGRTRQAPIRVKPGQGILWSSGPDGIDDGGHRHGDNPGSLLPQPGADLITVVDLKP